MIHNTLFRGLKLPILTASLLCANAQATIVKIETNLGDIEINLYDETTPKTVENFLDYVDNGAYNNNIVHRSVSDFIIQTGSYKWSIEDDQETEYANSIETNDIVENEPVWSNLKGTVAMAKTTAEHSATSGWFINLNDDNAANLDLQSNGFTVFGEVISGLEIAEQINELSLYNMGGAFTSIPLTDYTEGSVETENLVIINSVTVTDTSIDSAKDLTPTPNTLIYQQNLDLIAEAVVEIKKLETLAKGYLADAKTAQTKAADISEEKGNIAAAAVVSIELDITEIMNQLAIAEQLVVDADTAKSNEDSVMTIADFRDESIAAYSEAKTKTDSAQAQLNTAESAAKRSGSGGGSFPIWLTTLLFGGFLLKKRNLK